MKSNNVLTWLFCLLLIGSMSSSLLKGQVNRPEITAPYVMSSFQIDGDASDWSAVKTGGQGIAFYKGDGHQGTSSLGGVFWDHLAIPGGIQRHQAETCCGPNVPTSCGFRLRSQYSARLLRRRGQLPSAGLSSPARVVAVRP